MTFDITQVPITSKLMLLQGGCKNFRSIGEEVTINYAENSNLLVIADQNGAGKSTLFEHLPLYALTGNTSSKSDKVDALINTDVGKNMVCWLVWHFAGTYYKVIRGRKPSLFDIYSLVDGEWVEIPKLPVSSRDRQHLMYSLLGLDYKTASNVLENTVLLSGQRFKGFSSLSTPERRDLVEPILDLAIFSALNTETKTLRSEVIAEQKQTFLEVTDAKLQLALVEKDVEHKQSDIAQCEASYMARREELAQNLSKYTNELKEASELPVNSPELHVQFEGESEDLARELVELEDTLKSDLEGLGKFTVDETDSVLTKLKADLTAIDRTIESTKEALESKRKDVDGQVLKAKSDLESRFKLLEEDYKQSMIVCTENHNKALSEKQELKEVQYKALLEAQEDYAKSVEYHSDCSINVEGLTTELEALLVKEKQYQGKCDKLSDAIVYLEAKKSQEESNLEGLVSEGECPHCKSVLSTEYVEGLKTGLTDKIAAIDTDLVLYKERLVKGQEAVEDLDVEGLRKGLYTATLQLNESKPSSEVVAQAERKYADTSELLVSMLSMDVGEKLTNRYEYDKMELQNLISQAEAKIKNILGELETEYKLLVNNKPTQVENIIQQRDDRIEAMKGEFGGKERNLQKVYDLAVANVQERLKTAERRLREGVEWGVKNKNTLVFNLESSLKEIKDSIDKLEGTYKTSKTSLEEEYDSVLKKQFCMADDLTELNKEHDGQQQDIEDYNDMLLLLSDKEGKADIVRGILPKFNKDINTYLEAMGLFVNLEVDSEFNITMASEDRKGQSVYSLSAGQKSKLDLAILLSLRELAASKQSVDCNLLILDEVLDPLSCEALADIILMLQERFNNNNMVVITQRGEEVKDLFSSVKSYRLRGGFTEEDEH